MDEIDGGSRTAVQSKRLGVAPFRQQAGGEGGQHGRGGRRDAAVFRLHAGASAGGAVNAVLFAVKSVRPMEKSPG